MSEDLQDEVTSINSIYDPNTLIALTESTSESSEPGSTLYALTFPSLPSISLRLSFLPTYPEATPTILGTQSVGSGAAKGDGAFLVDLVREVLREIFAPGAPVIFDLVEEVGARVQLLGLGQSEGFDEREQQSEKQALADESSGQDGSFPVNFNDQDGEDEEYHGSDPGARQQDSTNNSKLVDSDSPEPPWVLSDAITEKKSVFLARSAPVTSPAQAQTYLAHLLASDKKAARATHNISAWRIRGANGTTYQDCDDDGESAAGGRVLRLLELMGVWDVMVVVSRWFGGVLLGGDRFRIINAVAREAVVRGGFLEGEGGGKDEGQSGGKSGGGKGKGKKK